MAWSIINSQFWCYNDLLIRQSRSYFQLSFQKDEVCERRIKEAMGVELSCCSSVPLHASLDPSSCESCRTLSHALADSLRQNEYLQTAPPTVMVKSGYTTPALVSPVPRKSLSGTHTPLKRTQDTSFLSAAPQWEGMSPCKWYFKQENRYSLVRLSPSSKKFCEIRARLSRSLAHTLGTTLARVERVQNRDLYRTFLSTQERLAHEAGRAVPVEELFYGTGRVDPYRVCAEDGLDSKEIQVFRRPLTCFLQEAKDCWKFAYRGRDGSRQLLLCLVAGESVEVAPDEDLSEPTRSESLIAKVRQGKSWAWVVYEAGRSYPAYILTIVQKT